MEANLQRGMTTAGSPAALWRGPLSKPCWPRSAPVEWTWSSIDRPAHPVAHGLRADVEVFEAHGVSFVAVTQQFNTTTSMGRLTLNVLLSFAQFERELAGERIRDKFAASRRKGIWMGGTVPLGYEVTARKLVINAEEAERVRVIFERYLALGCVSKLREDS